MQTSAGTAFLVVLYGFAAGMLLWASGLDIGWQQWLYANYHPSFNTLMRALSWLGLGRTQIWALIAVGLGLALYYGGLKGAWQALRLTGQQVLKPLAWLPGWNTQPLLTRLCLTALPVLAVSGLLQIVFKILIGRPRPKEMLWNGTDPFTPLPLHLDSAFWSFPSGHATSTFAIFTWLMLGLPRWRVPLFLIASTLSTSRFLAVTPHYVGDVVAGAALGAAVAIACWRPIHGPR